MKPVDKKYFYQSLSSMKIANFTIQFERQLNATVYLVTILSSLTPTGKNDFHVDITT